MAMLKAIHAQEDRPAAREKARLVAEKLDSMRLSQAATIVQRRTIDRQCCVLHRVQNAAAI
jgi:putative transposase